MIKYVMENINPKGKKTGDCVIRAIAKATKKNYYDVYKDLYDISVKTGYILNEKRCEEKLLEKYGFVKYKQPKKSDNTKYTIGEFDKLNVNGNIVIRCAHHLTCIIDNTLFDIWDCRYKSIGNYYVLEKEVK